MNKRQLIILFLLLLSATRMIAETFSLSLPAMIVSDLEGNKQVVQLDATDVSNLIVQRNGQSLFVDIPEAQIKGVKSITFAMIKKEVTPAPLEHTEEKIVNSVEKIMRNGKVLIRMHKQNRIVIEYDLNGNKVTHKQ